MGEIDANYHDKDEEDDGMTVKEVNSARNKVLP